MAEYPCNTCSEDCIGGIIYGNCPHYRAWFIAHNYLNAPLATPLRHPTESEMSLSGTLDTGYC